MNCQRAEARPIELEDATGDPSEGSGLLPSADGLENVNRWLETAVVAGLSTVGPWGSVAAAVASTAFARRRERIQKFGQDTFALCPDPHLLTQRLRHDERLAEVFISMTEVAQRTVLRAKLRVMARALGQALDDPAEVDTAELLTAALRDVDAVHLRLLERVSQAYDAHGPDDPAGAAKAAGDAFVLGIAPVRAALIRHGLVQEVPAVTTFGGRKEHGWVVSGFGADLLDRVRQASEEQND